MSKITKQQKLIAAVCLCAVVLIGVTVFAVIKIGTPRPKMTNGTLVKHPYALMVGDNELLLVKSKKDGENALNDVVETYTPKGTKLVSVDYDKKISVQEKELKLFQKVKTVLTEEQAAQKIIERNMSDTPAFVATIVSEKIKEKKIEPVVKFKYDDSLGLFDYKVITKGEEGTSGTRYEWVSQNGSIDSKKKTGTSIIKPVTNAVVKTGYDSAPKKMKWDDYDDYKKVVSAEAADYKVGTDMVNFGKKYLGVPYKKRGTNIATGVDCVGFVRQVYKKFGITLPRSRNALAYVGKGVSLKDARPGDIVHYGHHVAIYIGNGKIIHSERRGIRIGNVRCRKIKAIRRVKKK